MSDVKQIADMLDPSGKLWAAVEARVLAEDDPTVVRDVEELRRFPDGSVVVTGSGIFYVKSASGWSGEAGKRIPSSWLIDPEFSVQPLRVVNVCARCGVAS